MNWMGPVIQCLQHPWILWDLKLKRGGHGTSQLLLSVAGGGPGRRWMPYKEALGSQCSLRFQSAIQNPPATLSFGFSSLCPPPSDSKVFKAFLLSSRWKVHIPTMMTLQAPQIWLLYTFLHFPPPSTPYQELSRAGFFLGEFFWSSLELWDLREY